MTPPCDHRPAGARARGALAPGRRIAGAGKRFAVVFGATGLAGRYLAGRLADRGFQGWCLTRGAAPGGPAPYAPPPGFSWRTVSEAEPLTVPAAAALFSLAPITALPAILARTTGGDRLIALSTSSVCFKAESPDPRERESARRLRRAEDEARQLCERRRVVWTLFRPTLIYDPGRDRNVSAIASFVQRFRVFPIVRPGEGLRQPIHAEDVARAMAAALGADGARNTVLGLPGGETLTYREMVRRVFESLGRRPVVLTLPAGLARAGFCVWRALTGAQLSPALLDRMNASLTLDPAPVRETLGIACRPFRPKFPDR